MTALERRQDAALAVVPEVSSAVMSLASWAQEADAAYEIAQKLTDTSFCPQAFRGKPVEAAAAMLAGAEVGLSPLAALRSFDVIQGTAAPRALTLRAVAQSNGCEFVTVKEDARRVEMKGRRRGGEWETVVWTIERAQQLGLTGKDQWKKQPQTMLVARATAELARRLAADAILGIPYAAEELADDGPDTGGRTISRATPVQAPVEPEKPKAERKPTAARVTKAPVVADEPPLDDVPAAAEAPAEDPITAAQLTKLAICLKETEMDRETAFAFYADCTGRQVESSKELTKREASTIIDRLTQIIDAAKAAEATEPVDAEIVDDGLPL